MISGRDENSWGGAPPAPVDPDRRAAHVRDCSPFVAALLDRQPHWADDLDVRAPPSAAERDREIAGHGLESGLRRFRNHLMVRIIWRDLCGLAGLDETFADLTVLAELCLEAALDAHRARLVETHGEPVAEDGGMQHLSVIGLGKLGGGELNLSSDIDVMFCYGGGGETRGGSGRPLANDQFFIRQARAVIATLADVTEDGFCFRVDTRLRPFGEASPLCTSLAALEQYYQREGRDWERYALIKARPVAGDLELGRDLMRQVQPFVYRRYIDFSAVEALQEMHASVREDARRKDRLDDIKRGPGGIREIEFLAQCFQILRGGREPSLQTPSLARALAAIGELSLLHSDVLTHLRSDYVFLRQLENRIQAQRDQQLHRLPAGEDLERLARAMGDREVDVLRHRLVAVRGRVQQTFQGIFPSQPERAADPRWSDAWRAMQSDHGAEVGAEQAAPDQPLDVFLRNLDRLALSQRARRRLNGFMPVLLERLEARALDGATLHRVYDLVLAVCRRSAYLVLLVQNPAALDRMIDLFARSSWVAGKVTRFPALLDELIDPSLGRQIPTEQELDQSVARLLGAAQGVEAMLDGLNYLRLATTLRIAVALLQDNLRGEEAQVALAGLASALLRGVLELATGDIEERHGRIGGVQATGARNSLAVIAYGSLGAMEPGFDSDLDIVFLFRGDAPASDGERSLPPERYYARLAQRVLGFLTAMTPSGRLYAVDTRLRPNGRAGSLVSSIEAFADYQRDQAWTWELQALTRARHVAGNAATGAAFERIRRDVLCRARNRETLRRDLVEMRARMAREHGEGRSGAEQAKQRRGGLIDIEFIIQFGVLDQASAHPETLRSTALLEQLASLVDCGWIGRDQAAVLDRAARGLRRARMLEALAALDAPVAGDDDAVRAVFESRLGRSAEQA
jgi:glutamate-ammonia-ligase adenylyltransferase